MLFLLALMACRSADAPVDTGHISTDTDPGDTGDPGDTDTDLDTGDPDTGSGPWVTYHPALEDFGCASGTEECAAQGPWIDDTCCAAGASLVEVSTAQGSEVVGLEVDDRYLYACGGFGVRVSEHHEDGSTDYIGGLGPRCQHAVSGATASDGTQTFYLAHHGDSWVAAPSLTTAEVTTDGSLNIVDSFNELGVLFEDLAWADGRLYVAVHRDGVRVYTTRATGEPTILAQLTGFDNATRPALEGDHLYVTDNKTLHVFDVTPAVPERVATYTTALPGRNIAVDGVRAYVALGGAGVEVLDVTDPTAPARIASIATGGSVQDVAADNGKVAFAAWNHVQLLDANTLTLLGTKKTRDYDRFEQDLAIALRGDRVFVGEWEGVHVLDHQQGVVGPDIWIPDELINLPGLTEQVRKIRVTNRGPLPLIVSDISTAVPDAFSLSSTELSVEPGETEVVELTFTPPPVGEQRLTFTTNDPDPWQDTLEMPLFAIDSGALDVGDSIDARFEFMGDLEGQVVVLAYFALF
jgi:hypothetical protein